MLGIATINNQLSAWILSIPAATALAIAYSVMTTLFSNEVGVEKQGWIMGLTGALTAFSFGLSGLIAGVIVNFGASVPIWLAFICLTISAIIVSLTVKEGAK